MIVELLKNIILLNLFGKRKVDIETRKAALNLIHMWNYDKRYIQMIANANLEHPEAAAEEAAREFCVEWLEAQGFTVTLTPAASMQALEARDDHDSD